MSKARKHAGGAAATGNEGSDSRAATDQGKGAAAHEAKPGDNSNAAPGEKDTHGGQDQATATDSQATPTSKATEHKTGASAQVNTQDGGSETGQVAASTDGPEPAGAARLACEGRAQASNRWVREGRAGEVGAFRDRIRAECTAAGLSRHAARDEAWRRALAEFPPPGVTAVTLPDPVPDEPIVPDPVPPADSEPGGLSGLGDLPDSWPALPPNAPLAAEVQWVQSSRLLVRQGDSVDLSRALSPAPSYAALAWLETSILFPSKWADIVARATTGQGDEREAVRRERLSIEAVRGLLAEMVEADSA